MVRNLDFSWQFGDYEIATIREHYDSVNHCYDKKTPINKRHPIELLKKTEHGSFVIAWFQKDEEGYELRSVGGRLFEEIDAGEIGRIWAQLQAAQKMLDAMANAEYMEKYEE